MANCTVERVDLFHLELPLSQPYHLAFGDLTAFDTMLVRVRVRGGAEAWGETTPLRGYSPESPEDVWRAMVQWSGVLRGRPLADALALLDTWSDDFPFACAGIATACEHLLSEAAHGAAQAKSGAPVGSVPLIGTIRSSSPEVIADEVPGLLGAGYTSLKLKAGTDVARDLANVRAAQRALRGRGRLRIDANQGFSLEQARVFVDGLDPTDIELFEQPFPPDRWDWMELLGPRSNVPLMLDESIEHEADVVRASGVPAVRYVKFKLMKAGSVARLRRLVDRATALGLGVIVGNGVAGDLGCLHEAWAVADRLTLPGEMNGFLKPVESLLAEPLCVVSGALMLPAPSRTAILLDRLERYRVTAHST